MRLTVDGAAVAVPGRLRLAVLALLALAEGRAVPASTLIDALWPEDPPPTGVSALHSHISRLRAHLGPAADRLRRYEGAYALALRPDELDVARARRLAGEVADLLTSDPRRAAELGAEALRTVAGHGAGRVLRHAGARRRRRRPRRAAAAPRRRPAAGGDRPGTPGVSARAATAAAADPLRERTVVLHVRALAAEDRAAEALEVAARYRRRLADETGLDPGPALRALETDVAAGSLAPPPMTAARRVARPVTPFVGREHDRAELLRLLDLDGSAPVSVVGPGGVGKTRLSLEVLADISDRGANRGADRREVEVVVVPLATVVDAAGLPGAVAAALGLVIAPGATPARKLDAPAADPSIDAVAAALAGRRLLLLLDNCEHLIDRCRDLVIAIGAAAPGVQVLATSRVSLHVPGEYVMRLLPLPLPRDAADAETYARQPSVAAFVEHAQRRDVGYRLTVEDGPVVADIVSRLDGLPLAIELAAGQAAAMSLPALRARLNRALHALAADRPPDQARHRTLHDTVEWSFRLLAPDEQLVLLTLAPMAGGADLDTIEAFAREVTQRDPLSILSRLVDSSLVVAPHAQDAHYTVLETVRAYLAEELEARGEHGASEARFLRWARMRAADLRRDLRSEREPEADRRLRREMPNLRVAMHVARARGDLDAMVDIVLALDEPAVWRDLSELWVWTMELADQAELAAHPRRVELLGAAAESAWLSGSLDRATTYFERAGAAEAEGAARFPLWRGAAGAVALFRGHFTDSERWYREGAEFTDTPGALLATAALAACYGGDSPDELLAQARAALATRPYPGHSAYLHYIAGEIAARRGNVLEAAAEYGVAITLARGSGARFVEGVAMVGLASAEIAAGRPGAAADGYRELLDRWFRSGSSTQLWTTARNAAKLLLDCGTAPATAALLLAAADSAPSAAAVTGEAGVELAELRRRAEGGMSDAERAELAVRARTVPTADLVDEAVTALRTVG